MSDPEDMKFVDSGQDDVLFDKGDSQTINFTNFPNSAVDDDDEDSEDKSQLLKDEKKGPSFWTFEYYQQFFDVETRQVGHRVLGSMLPIPTRNYLTTHIRPTPDLYGPFWICTTLVFTTAIAGNLANYLSSGGKDYEWRYDFHKVTFAATAIFSYWWLIPALVYGLLWWRKSQAGYTFLEILCLYGYSLAIYIPISILWVVNITWFKWLLVVAGALLSGGVLVIALWPAVRDDTRQMAYLVAGLVFLFHLMLAAGFVLYFFHVPAAVVPTEPPATVKPLNQVPEKVNKPAEVKQPLPNNPAGPAKQPDNSPKEQTNDLPQNRVANLPQDKLVNKAPEDQLNKLQDVKPVEKVNDTGKGAGGVVKKAASADTKAVVGGDKAQLDAPVGAVKDKLVKRRSKLLRAVGRKV